MNRLQKQAYIKKICADWQPYRDVIAGVCYNLGVSKRIVTEIINIMLQIGVLEEKNGEIKTR